MIRVRIPVLLAVAACLLALLALPALALGASPRTSMLKKVNAFRRAHGLHGLHLSRSLMHSAQKYADYMMRSGYFGHASRIHASSRYRTLGEAIEMHRGSHAGVTLTLRDWEHSPPHRALLLYSSFQYGGAGYVTGRFHGHRETIWVMHFGRH